jgi:carbohydrate-selective porin OprB
MARRDRKPLFFALVLISGGMAESALAVDLSGAYVGGNFGRAQNQYDTSSIDSQIESEAQNAGTTATFTSRSTRKLSDAWWINAGYFVNSYVGLDAAFFHLGELKYEASGTLTGFSGAQTLDTQTEITSHGPAISLMLRLPLTESFAADLRVGDYYGKSTVENYIAVGSSSSSIRASSSASSLLVGAGASYTFAGHWSIRLDYLRVNKTGDSQLGRFSVNLASAGVSFTF